MKDYPCRDYSCYKHDYKNSYYSHFLAALFTPQFIHIALLQLAKHSFHGGQR